MTERRSIGTRLVKPSAIICGPPMPSNLRSGRCFSKARIRPAPSMSPEASPATITMVLSDMDNLLANDTAARIFQRSNEHRQFIAVNRHLLQVIDSSV